MKNLSKKGMTIIESMFINIWFKLLPLIRYKRYAIERIGTSYGGWCIPENLLNSESVCYLAGAGEDISFDVGIVRKYNCEVFIIDPTPRAYSHFKLLIQNTQNGIKTSINKSSQTYDLFPDKIEKLNYLRIGLWSNSSEIKFFEPKDPNHVSHSALNLQNTQKYFAGQVKRISELMKELNHFKLDLLKIDIEGAEYKVIDSIIQDRIHIKVICVEFDEANNPLDEKFLLRIRSSLKALFKYGYRIIDYNDKHNYTLIRKDLAE